MDLVRDPTSNEAFTVICDSLLIFILAAILVINAVISFRKVLQIVATTHRRRTTIAFRLRTDRLVPWLAFRLIEFALFMACLTVLAKKIVKVANAMEERYWNGLQLEVRVPRPGWRQPEPFEGWPPGVRVVMRG